MTHRHGEEMNRLGDKFLTDFTARPSWGDFTDFTAITA
jgi:hypothetical protein